jgi:hypothetical protein
VILCGRGENLSVHGRRDNKPSLSTVWQKYANGLPTVCQTRRNPRSTQPSQTVRKNPFPTPIRPHETISETVPRLRRDCSETNGRPLEDSIFRIRPEMLEQETRQRTRSERMPEPLLTLKEAADYLRLTPAALYTQRHRGDKPGALGIRVGRKILYRPSDINRYLDEQLAENQVSLHR